MGAKWHLPGVTELNQLVEDSILIQPAGGAGNIVAVQEAGFINKLNGYLEAQVLQTVAAVAPAKSIYGPLGGTLRRLQVSVAGRKPFFDLSGLGLAYYNEVANPDASVMAPPAFLAAANEEVIVEGTHLTAHTAGAAGVQTYNLRRPFELNFGIPVWMTRLLAMGKDYIPVMSEEEVGLWYLQERKTKLNIEADFYPSSVAAGPLAPYFGAGVTSTYSPTVNHLRFERELFSVPPDTDAWPDQGYVHQVIEYTTPIAGNTFDFPIPQVGSLLRAMFIPLDANGLQVQWTDLTHLRMRYGASDTPIDRPGWALVSDYEHDYGRYPPTGLVVLDFYKEGLRAARLARDTDRVANLAFQGDFTATATGQVRIILESLVPQEIQVA